MQSIDNKIQENHHQKARSFKVFQQRHSIINRFMCRVKEILAQINLCIPKEKIQIIIILKKLELITLKSISVENSPDIIAALLDILGNCNVKMIHALKIKPIAIVKEPQTERLI